MGELGRCVAVIEGCARCERRSRCDGDCDDLCRMVADLVSDDDGHEHWHRQGVCSGCGADLDEDGALSAARCRHGRCRIHSCAQCGTEKYANGPVGCRCSTTTFTRFLLNVWWPMTRWLRRRTDA